MKIIVGEKSGFCYGVQKAVEKAEVELVNTNDSLYCLGELVHNKTVTDGLKKKGLILIDDISQAKGKTVIRAHGVPKEVYEEAKRKGIELIDLTCPNVLKIHKTVSSYQENEYYIFLIGKENHPETIGTISFCGNNAKVISHVDEVQSAIEEFKQTNLKKILVISQTTYSLEQFHAIVEEITKQIGKEIKLEVMNTICSATELRQKETEELSKQVELMIVIGGKNSSNTTKLYEICLKNCENVIFVENEQEIDVKEVQKYEKIGIVAGASTPKSSIESIVKLLKNEEEIL